MLDHFRTMYLEKNMVISPEKLPEKLLSEQYVGYNNNK